MAMAIALHNPGKLYKRNQGLRQMSDEQLDEYASTKRKGLPKYSEHVKKVMRGGKK
jgi:hypothetical protein